MRAGNYRVQVYDFNMNQYVPTPLGLGMHVNTYDPEQKIVLSRVRTKICVSHSRRAPDTLLW